MSNKNYSALAELKADGINQLSYCAASTLEPLGCARLTAEVDFSAKRYTELLSSPG